MACDTCKILELMVDVLHTLAFKKNKRVIRRKENGTYGRGDKEIERKRI